MHFFGRENKTFILFQRKNFKKVKIKIKENYWENIDKLKIAVETSLWHVVLMQTQFSSILIFLKVVWVALSASYKNTNSWINSSLRNN